MKNRLSAVSGVVLLACAAVFPNAAFANSWSSYLYDGTHYGITDGDTKLPLDLTEKEANRTAHKVNKALGKDKPDEGVVDAPNSPCHDPSSGVVC